MKEHHSLRKHFTLYYFLFACFLSGHFVFDSILMRDTYEQAAFLGVFHVLGGMS